MEQEKSKTVNINDLKMNDIVHDKLSPEQLARINAFHKALKEVNVTPIEKTIENFQRDAHPDNEIAIWEKIAKAYQNINKDNDGFQYKEKYEVYKILLLSSLMPKEQVFQNLNLEILSKEQAETFITYYGK